MPALDGAQFIQDQLVAYGVLPEGQIFKGPPRPALEVNVRECVFINDQGGLPSMPYLCSEGTLTTNYFDVWVRSARVDEGRARCLSVRDALQLYSDVENGLVSIFFVQGPVYNGRDGEDTHNWRCSFKTVLYETKDAPEGLELPLESEILG